MNQSESASMEGLLRQNDYEIVGPNEEPDLCIINTCTVTAKSDHQSRQLVRKAARTGAKIIATGCYAQLKAEELIEINGIDLVLGNSAKGSILDHIASITTKADSPVSIIDAPDSKLEELPYYSTRSRAFLKIQDGCNFACSYCAVPSARGKSRSLDEKAVIASVEKLAADGYKEIIITGIHTGLYGADLTPENSLLDLIITLTEEFPDISFRLSSLEPQEFKEGFLQLINDGKICPHIHIPLQSGSDKILRAMNRGYSSTFYEQLINRIVTACPDISIGTDVIAGFPGESEKEFTETVNFIKNLPLSYLHVFPYSNRPGTTASSLECQVDDAIKRDRVKKLLEISSKLKNSYISKSLDRVLNVIVENKPVTDGFYNAISDNYLRVLVKSKDLKPGQNLRVKVNSIANNTIIAQPLLPQK